VVAHGIPFASLCRHHLLPFSGLAHVGYLPGDRILGLSKLARVALEAEHVCMTVRGVQAPACAPSPRPCAAGSATTPAPGPSSSPWPRP
jgi:GTP cyclohydrolase I